MKPNIMDLLKRLLNIGSHLHTITDVFGAFTGKVPYADASSLVKGLYGVFGYADERAFAVLINQLEKKHPGSREVISGFLDWHFKRGNLTERTLSFWYGNAFRSFVTKMGSAEGHIKGKKSTTLLSPDSSSKSAGDATTVIESEIREEGTNNALDFLEMMWEVITSEEKREDGYDKLLREFQSFSYPHVPDGASEVIGSVANRASTAMGQCNIDPVRTVIRETANTLEASLAEKRRQKSSLRKLLDKRIY